PLGPRLHRGRKEVRGRPQQAARAAVLQAGASAAGSRARGCDPGSFGDDLLLEARRGSPKRCQRARVIALLANHRVGLSRVALATALVAVVAIAGLGAYVAFAPSGPATTTRTSSTTSTSSTSSTAASVTVALAPPSPMVSPGETQNYSLVEVSVAGSGTGGTLNLEAFPPSGLSLVFNQTSVPLSGGTQSVPVMLKAAAGLSPGNYSVIIETTSSAAAATNHTFTVQVVPMLVIMQDFAFHPQNITVTSGTRV